VDVWGKSKVNVFSCKYILLQVIIYTSLHKVSILATLQGKIRKNHS